MKSIRKYTKLLLAGGLLLGSAALTSCDDYLTMLPTNQLPEENFWQDKTDLDGVRAGAYEKLSQASMIQKIILWGEVRSDNLKLKSVSNTDYSELQGAVLRPAKSFYDWSGFYSGINYCNLVIEKGYDMTEPGKEVDPSFTRSDYNTINAEMLALRSLYYFYLVRAYRDVPYVTHSIRTDAEANVAKPAAETGVSVLGACIDTLESVAQYGAENYGTLAKNKGWFTKLGIHALLADMYLWRACLLKNFIAKVDTTASPGIDGYKVNMSDVRAANSDGTYYFLTTDSTQVNQAYCNTLANTCLDKAIEHATWCIDELKADYIEDLDDTKSTDTNKRNNPYSLTQNGPTPLVGGATGSLYDSSYGANFGGSQNNEFESILELQYTGTSTKNSTVDSYYSQYSSGDFNAGTFVASNSLTNSATSVNPTVGFGKTDLRLLETCYYPAKDEKPITKFILRTLTVNDITDLSGSNPMSTFTTQTSGSNNSHWMIYRLSDVMMIKAEAIARRYPSNNGESDENIKEGFKLVNELFKRNNPALTGSSGSPQKEELKCDRLDDTYASGKTGSNLLELVYRERQREFFGEGKRWFDLVRQCESAYDRTKNTPKAVLAAYGDNFTSSVLNKLTRIYSLYNPIYSEELDVNGVEYGGKLVQNPVWDRYTVK